VLSSETRRQEADMVEATRTRVGVNGETLTMAVCIAGTLVVGLLAVRELRVVPRAFAQVSAPSSSAVEAVPSQAVSVPALLVGAENEIKVGDPLAFALGHLDRTVELLAQTVEPGPLGRREVRSYRRATTRFVLVAEPFDRAGEPRVSAIYLQ
jgi:hypothetical protein